LFAVYNCEPEECNANLVACCADRHGSPAGRVSGTAAVHFGGPGYRKKGETITAKGENLGKSGVGELYLTDGQKDTKVDITSESDTEIKFTIPDIKAGRYHLLILTANKASLIEQPVVVTVE